MPDTPGGLQLCSLSAVLGWLLSFLSLLLVLDWPEPLPVLCFGWEVGVLTLLAMLGLASCVLMLRGVLALLGDPREL